MRITLLQLDRAYKALDKLAQIEFPKERHKLAYKLSRVLKSAQVELEAATESLNDLRRKCGLEDSQGDMKAKLADYQIQFNDFMKSTFAELWGDPIQLDDLGEISISASDLALLDWLILGEQPQEAQGEAKTAHA